MISIIIIVKNDIRIAKLLDKLKIYNKNKDTEVLVIDASQGLLDSIKNSNRYVKWKYYKTTQKSSIPEQRNIGILNAKGNVLIFIDSDCIPQKNWLKNLILPIVKEGEFIVAGKVIHSDKKSLHSIESERHNMRTYIGEAPTMNIAIKKAVFTKIGLFDNNFQCGEDVDLLWRATRKGYKIRLQTNARVTHDLGNYHNELRRMYRYGKARVMLYKKHSYKQRLFWGSEISKIFYFLYILFLPISLIFPAYLLILIIYVFRNYKDNPLKKFIYKASCGLGMIMGIKSYYINNLKLYK